MGQEKDENLSGEHAREGLTAVVAVRVSNPEFEGQTKVRGDEGRVRGSECRRECDPQGQGGWFRRGWATRVYASWWRLL